MSSYILAHKSRGKLNKTSKLIPAVQEILKEYSNMRLTVRAVYYRLVSKGLIKNTLNQYNMLSRSLAKARWHGFIPFTAFEDQVRETIGSCGYSFDSPEDVFNSAQETFESAEETFNGCASNFYLPRWHGQPNHVEVWLEKQALANLFEQVTEPLRVRLCPCRGYPSLTFLYESAAYMKHYVPQEKKLKILYFGDYDVRGLDIQRNINQVFQMFGLTVEMERIALTKEQIQQYNLPPAPAKKGDSMASGWIENQGDVAWELDALEPQILLKLIREAIEKEFDNQAYQKREQQIEEGRNRIEQLLENYNNGEEPQP